MQKEKIVYVLLAWGDHITGDGQYKFIIAVYDNLQAANERKERFNKSAWKEQRVHAEIVEKTLEREVLDL